MTISRHSIIAIALLLAGCGRSAAVPEKSMSDKDARPSTQATPTPFPPAQPKEILMTHIFTREKSLSYNGFDVTTIAKRLNDKPSDISYAAIKKNERVIARFDNSQEEGMNATSIGLFPLLGNKTKQ